MVTLPGITDWAATVEQQSKAKMLSDFKIVVMVIA
jgi:hypothetical protein